MERVQWSDCHSHLLFLLLDCLSLCLSCSSTLLFHLLITLTFKSWNPFSISLCKTTKFDVYLTEQALHGLIQQHQFAFITTRCLKIFASLRQCIHCLQNRRQEGIWVLIRGLWSIHLIHYGKNSHPGYEPNLWHLERSLVFLSSYLNYQATQRDKYCLVSAGGRDTRMLFLVGCRRTSLPTSSVK